MPRLAAACLAVSLLLAVPAAAAGKPRDRNHDRIPDRWEKAHGVWSKQRAVATRDADGDGLSNWGEWRSGTDPRRRDSDGNGRPDAAEDRDADGLANAFELSARTDPGKPDSDGDRRRDGAEDPDRDRLANAAEQRFDYLPRTRDSDGDGTGDGAENPGTISAVAGDQLTIRLARGGKLVATVGKKVKVACGAPAEATQPEEPSELPAEETGGEGLVEPGLESPPTGEFARAAQAQEPPVEEPPVEEPPFEEPPVEEFPVEELPAEEELPVEEIPAEEELEGTENPLESLAGECAAALTEGGLVRAATVKGAGKSRTFTALELLAPASF